MAEGYVIKCLGFANGSPCEAEGQWLEEFDHEAHKGQGEGAFTSDADKAMLFASASDALEFYRKQSNTKPLRDDGQPNRPLTCMNALIEKLTYETLQ